MIKLTEKEYQELFGQNIKEERKVKINNFLKDLGGIMKLEKVINGLEKTLGSSWGWVKRHRKLLVTLGVVYFVWQWLFDEKGENSEKEE